MAHAQLTEDLAIYPRPDATLSYLSQCFDIHARHYCSLVSNYDDISNWYGSFLEQFSSNAITEARRRTWDWAAGATDNFLHRLQGHLMGRCSFWKATAMGRARELAEQQEGRTPDIPPLALEPQVNQRRVYVMPILEKKGWSVLDWANASEVSHATAMDYLDDKSKPYPSTRFKLAKALNIPVEQLPR